MQISCLRVIDKVILQHPILLNAHYSPITYGLLDAWYLVNHFDPWFTIARPTTPIFIRSVVYHTKKPAVIVVRC